MKPWLARNIDGKGRAARGLGGVLLWAGAGFGFTVSPWLSAALGVAGAFLVFEALRGWCALRACGVKTKF